MVSVPGRVNLIGEHIDYHGLPVLPIAMRRYVRVAFRARQDRLIRAVSTAPYGAREFASDCVLPSAADCALTPAPSFATIPAWRVPSGPVHVPETELATIWRRMRLKILAVCRRNPVRVIEGRHARIDRSAGSDKERSLCVVPLD